MNIDALPGIPRLYTAIAEWAACLVYILILKKRFRGTGFILRIALGFLIQVAIQITAGHLPLAFWVPGMFAAVCGMYGFIFINSDITVRDMVYCSVCAFILAEFAASLSWQLYRYFFNVKANTVTLSGIIFTLLIYAVVLVSEYFLECRHLEKGGRLNVTYKELRSVIAISLGTFLVSNISFVTANTPFSSRLVPELFYIRTLVDFSGLIILYTYQEQRKEMRLQYELKAMQDVLHRQFEQYQHSKESMELINRKYHDLKYQIAVIRTEQDPAKRAAYLDEMDNEIKMRETQNKTGNQVLDTVLMTKNSICAKNDISLTCVADGALLAFMEVMDICSIFGNALGNAIESVLKIDDHEKRLIHIALYSQNNFIIIRFENYFENEVAALEGGLPTTTKSGKSYHGFGLKSIRYMAEKYGGSMTINTEDGWFILRILLPVPRK
jgi:hypothetical protein